MQMPGLCGDPLARLLRASAGPHLRLFAMSGSNPTPDATRNYDAFLLKPLSIDDLETLLNQLPHPAAQPALTGDDDAILNRATFNGLAHSMPKPQLHALYKLCLDDAEKRIASMRLSRSAHDNDAYIRAAHAIKGGCGMVGASANSPPSPPTWRKTASPTLTTSTRSKISWPHPLDSVVFWTLV